MYLSLPRDVKIHLSKITKRVNESNDEFKFSDCEVILALIENEYNNRRDYYDSPVGINNQ